MITYKTCTETTLDQIFDAFCLGFSDYIIPLTMSQEVFEDRFFGAEGNSLNHSFLAFDENRPIGLILSGIRSFDGLKTMRCGTLCVATEYRGQGISRRLLEMHKAAAAQEGCKQLFLEVIKGNDRAVRFYKRAGYTKTYDLKYYSGMLQALHFSEGSRSFPIREISFERLNSFRKALVDCHINWQSDTPYYAASTTNAYLAAYEGHDEIAFIAMTPQGKINFLWVDPAYRNQGLGSSMIQKAAQAQNVEKLSISLPNHASLMGFLRKLGFQKEALEQHEMYLPL